MAFRQAWTLVGKNIIILLYRHLTATVFRALILPLTITLFLCEAKNLFISPGIYGIGNPNPIRALSDALEVGGGSGRHTLAFVNNDLTGGDIDSVINSLASIVTDAGLNAPILTNSTQLQTTCPSTLRGVTPCFAAVIFNSSPKEGPGGLWNYTLRVDGALGAKVNVNSNSNDAEIYLLPLQRAVDSAIASLRANSSSTAMPDTTNVYIFTTIDQQQKLIDIREAYQGTIEDWMAVSFIVGMIGIVYHMVGFIASERETGMSQLIEAMMSTRTRWESQTARLWSYHFTFSCVYLPGWVIISLFVGRLVFSSSSVILLLICYILTGLALASLSLLASAFFKKARLSGITATIIFLLLAILAQSISYPNTATVLVLSLLFTPCNFVFFLTFVARSEANGWKADLKEVAPDSPWNIKGYVLLVFLLIQIVVYPLIATYIERLLYGTSSKNRTVQFGRSGGSHAESSVQLQGFTKVFRPSLLSRVFSFTGRAAREPVVAVDNLTFNARKGQVLALLGANGSGKSTTLDAIAGTSRLDGTKGSISLDLAGGLGFVPQRNVLWDELTVREHIAIFKHLKPQDYSAANDEEEIRALIRSIGLEHKTKARSKTLSGGLKRKLQLGMMLTGGSTVCLIDEVSSGLDPISRRKIWDIILAERGRRTIIMTTHFLDEADLLADHIVILSKGTLRAEGSSVELKDRLGGGYRINIPSDRADIKKLPDVDGVPKRAAFDFITYVAETPGLAAQVIKSLELAGIHNYGFSGPKIEDVFMQVSDEFKEDGGAQDDGNDKLLSPEDASQVHGDDPGNAKEEGSELLTGRRTGFMTQVVALLLKRCTILRTNWFHCLAALAIPIVTAGLTTIFVRGQTLPSCGGTGEQTTTNATYRDAFNSGLDTYLVGGPSSDFSNSTLASLFLPIIEVEVNSSRAKVEAAALSFLNTVHTVDSFEDFTNYVVNYRTNITPAGLWLGNSTGPPTLAYLGNAPIYTALFGQNYLDILLSNTTILTSFARFNIPWAPSTGNSLQLLVYFGLAMCAYPAFFALYPTLERRRQVRSLEYSNGVRCLPLWTAYLIFDFAIVVISSIVAATLFATLSSAWYNVGYLYLIFLLYGLASVLLAHVISLFAASQLSAYAFTAAGQGVFFLVYLVAYFCVLTYAAAVNIDKDLALANYLVSAFAPVGSLARALFLALNLFSATCDGFVIAPNPGAFDVYGSCIMYLVLQSLLLFAFLIWIDSGAGRAWYQRRWQRGTPARPAQITANDVELAQMTADTGGTTTGNDTADGLRLDHITKSFGRNLAVDDVTFGVRRGEVFALLGPNGAGKSTIISLIRGDVQPSRNLDSGGRGDIFVEDISVTRRLNAARARLGVCPQFDAIDQLTVRQHLAFYARVQGVADTAHNVRAVLAAVGLVPYADRWAASLSGGNRRKLALGVALMGNPGVILLDEPTSSLDAAAKRVMWRTLAAAAAPGRSILLTTHSMEEADALAGHVGILARRMLALGTTDELRRRVGDALHVHIVCKGVPRTPPDEMRRIRARLLGLFPSASIEEETYHGQMRFSVPAAEVLQASSGLDINSVVSSHGESSPGAGVEEIQHIGDTSSRQSAIGRLIVMLEERKDELGIEHYGVTPTTLDQVFLAIVGQHNIQEEDTGDDSWWKRLLWCYS